MVKYGFVRKQSHLPRQAPWIAHSLDSAIVNHSLSLMFKITSNNQFGGGDGVNLHPQNSIASIKFMKCYF